MSLKDKTVSGLIWSFAEKFSSQLITFIVGIVLARLLSPEEFGLVGMLAIFISISQIFIQSGFNQALIRKKDCSDADYSTVFYFNAAVSLVLYLLLVLSAGFISDFYEEPVLKPMIRVLALALIINAFTIVQQTMVVKEIDFKVLTKVSLVSSVGSGIVGILLAVFGFGVWALVYKMLAQYLIRAIMLWALSKWKPLLVFSKQSFKVMFSFGGRLMVLGVIDTVYQNVYFLIIGKYYSAAQLGLYTRAEAFKDLPVKSLSGIVESVSYPVLSQIQDDVEYLRNAYRRLIKSTMLLTMLLMFGLSAIAPDLTVLMLGTEWYLAGEYLQVLCFAGIFYPINALNANILKVKGRSDIILNLGIVKKIVAIPVILLAIFTGIESMLLGMVAHQIIVFCLNSYWGGKEIGYPTQQQVKDLLPSLSVSLVLFALLTVGAIVLQLDLIYKVSILLISGGLLTLASLELTQLDNYLYVKNIILGKYKQFRTTKVH
jgi:teichuronic acid exporter